LAKILEILTINIAVKDLVTAVSNYQKLGLKPLATAHMPEPPAQITDISFPFSGGGFSVIAPTDETSPLNRFLDKKGEGVYSVCLRTDNIRELMHEWGGRGIGWVLGEPAVLPDNPAAQYKVERLLMNWTRPSSLHGLVIEVMEFQGKVSSHPYADEVK
jgi:methylmalonyl-CoA/ethylmalonyl-CoA epimerase